MLVAMSQSSSKLGLGSGSSFFKRDFVRRVRGLCARERLLTGTETVLVMVSGGQDSVALLHLLTAGGLRDQVEGVVAVLHVNHALRGEESEADETLVRQLCEQYRVPLMTSRRAVGKERGNVQAEARDARRAAGEEAALELGADRVALGHTLDDQVENMLYRVGRYGGMDALAGMGSASGIWVRPLLGVRRWETAEYCRLHNLSFARDAGNEDPRYARTGLREKVLPAWEEVLPGAVPAAGRTAEVVAEAAGVYGSIAQEALRRVSVPRRDPLVSPGAGAAESTPEISVARFQRLSPPVGRAVLHLLLAGFPQVNATRELVLAVEKLLAAGGYAQLDIGGGLQAVKVYDRLLFSRERSSGAVCSEEGEEPGVELPVPGEVLWRGIRIVSARAERVRAHDPYVETYVDARATRDVLTVRAAVSGDRMHPLGAPGRRSVQDIMVDRRVPRTWRNRVPVVEGGGEILWLAGLITTEQGRIRADTDDLVHLAVENAEHPCAGRKLGPSLGGRVQ